MENFSVISIGINRYQLIQPLNFACEDARAIGQFVVEEGQLPAERVLLLDDTSPAIEDRSTLPTKEQILHWLQVETASPNDRFMPWLWFFFSGYGVSWEGQDYLLPIDANLADIPNTAIPMRWVLDILQRKEARNILLLLDINRSPGLIAANNVGAETLELAKERGLNVILSSQLEQMSHESSDLEHGFFTASLLEVLRYYGKDLTLDKLEEYLRDRLPELCEHHWRPPQRPLFLIPFAETSKQPLLPSQELVPSLEEYALLTPALVEANGQYQSNGKANDAQIATSAPIVRPNAPLLVTEASNSAPPSIPPVPSETTPTKIDKTPNDSWQSYQKWFALGGGLFLLLALAGVFLRPDSQVADSTRSEVNPPVDNPVAQEKPIAPSAEKPAVEQPILPPPGSAPQAAVKPAPAASPVPVPPTAPVPPVQGATQPGDLAASVYLKEIQASKFGRAIADARGIAADSPDYAEAQKSIQRWSLAVLDIARGRAKQGDFSGAIAAAAIVAPDYPEAYQLAQQKSATWKLQAQQQERNQAILAAAQKRIRPNVASSYNQAIETLRVIPVGQPGYARAKQLKESWSKTIYKMASDRAVKGDFKAAIETAQLVPADSAQRAAANQAIARWKKGN
ncbi:caspase family protein [Oscillatoria sp. FACHB-1406]|uniref:caspase family protein n=1 Tax=Oscillatoria sp. FACHB-1406 TaxID=2692846 RepID=UPI00168937D3|nr:caspase family protein [Oscillatoria sp. FACHB-1406]MBD2576626.1 caspase family protein [Oscillatoria sp. FACHB-1406]